MNLDLNKLTEKIQQNDFIQNFMKELSKALESFKNQNELKGEKMDNIQLTQEEDLEFFRKKMDFLQEYFKNELTNVSKGELFLVTDKYENDYEYHRYKVAQYIDNRERKYITFEKDLPQDVKLGDVVRKIDGKYMYDEQATMYVNDTINELKEDIINRRKMN